VRIFPISFFGPISYYQQLIRAENVLFEIYETYQKQSLRNRYSIGSSNGILDLTIPITKPNGSKTITKDILIDDTQQWKVNHWRAITSAYMHAPYFEHYEIDIYNLIFSEENILYKKDIACFNFFNKTFELDITFKFTKEYKSYNIENDFRNKDFLNHSSAHSKYIQPFNSKFGFTPNLSILDLLFCEGPIGRFFLKQS
jgi:hypothetical protein